MTPPEWLHDAVLWAYTTGPWLLVLPAAVLIVGSIVRDTVATIRHDRAADAAADAEGLT
jgi:hypothetical protein